MILRRVLKEALSTIDWNDVARIQYQNIPKHFEYATKEC